MDILQKIIKKICIDEKDNFNAFDKNSFGLVSMPVPKAPSIGSEHPFFLIAEIKKASPSRGVIREVFDPLSIARSYIQGGACALSVITEKNFFQGQKEYLKQIRAITELPLLRKDFIIHPRQVSESFNLGADMVLLIASVLNDEMLHSLYRDILNLKMTPFIEIHNQEELDRVLVLNPPFIGINNRDLRTFSVDIAHGIALKKRVPPGIPVIAESGISTAEDIRILKQEGFAGALVGESLLRQDNLVKAVADLEI